jgi:hypothetical protein
VNGGTLNLEHTSRCERGWLRCPVVTVVAAASERRRSGFTRAALFVAWLLLIVVNMVNAHRTEVLIQTVQTDLRDTTSRVCGAWLGTYQMLNVWASYELSPGAATAVRERFAADFREHCPDYEQAFPSPPLVDRR